MSRTSTLTPLTKHHSLDRFSPLILLAIIILGGLLRLHQIGSKGLWLDEAFSVWMGRQPLNEMFGWLLKVDQHPPLYYTILHFWLAFGDEAAVVRAFSALVSTLTIPVVYWLGHQVGGRTIALLVAFILALSPFHVRFAQETRMYALLTLNASLAMLALVYLLTDSRSATIPIGGQLRQFYRTWRDAQTANIAHTQVKTPIDFRSNFRSTAAWLNAPTQRRWLPLQAIKTDLAWLGYIVFTVATLLSHNTAIFFPIAVNLFVLNLIGWHRPGAKKIPTALKPPSSQNWLVAQVGIFLLWSPWLAAFVIQSIGVDREFWISAPTVGTVFWTLKNFLSPFLPGQITWANIIWGLYGLVSLLGMWSFRRQSRRLLLLLTLMLTPIIGELLVSLRRPLFYDRTLIWATVPIYLLLAAGINQLRYRSYILTALAILVTINGLSLREYYLNFEKEQWDDAAHYVAEHVDRQDLIIFNATWVQIPFDFYFRHFNRRVAEHGAPVDLFDRDILEPKMSRADVPRLRSLIRQYERTWLVYSHNWYTDPEGIVVNTLSEDLTLLEKQTFYGVEIHLYGTP